jgi:hypothetical protein
MEGLFGCIDLYSTRWGSLYLKQCICVGFVSTVLIVLTRPSGPVTLIYLSEFVYHDHLYCTSSHYFVLLS